jgi:hypothetical protein
MRKITFFADENLIKEAWRTARQRRTTLGAAFREWLSEFAGCDGSVCEYDSLMQRLRHVKAGRPFARDEMNQR